MFWVVLAIEGGGAVLAIILLIIFSIRRSRAKKLETFEKRDN